MLETRRRANYHRRHRINTRSADKLRDAAQSAISIGRGRASGWSSPGRARERRHPRGTRRNERNRRPPPGRGRHTLGGGRLLVAFRRVSMLTVIIIIVVVVVVVVVLLLIFVGKQVCRFRFVPYPSSRRSRPPASSTHLRRHVQHVGRNDTILNRNYITPDVV